MREHDEERMRTRAGDGTANTTHDISQEICRPEIEVHVDWTVAQLQRIREVYPDLMGESGELHLTRGQFNDVLLVDGCLVFRFPRFGRAAAILQAETVLLRALQGRLPLSIPDPTYLGFDPKSRQLAFMGYRLIPGEPLALEALAAIQDEATLKRLAVQLATFLRALHRIPAVELGIALPVVDGREDWERPYRRFQTELFGFMRRDAREAVARRFDGFLAEPSHFAYQPVLRHGDFGGSNILFDATAGAIRGVIDFSAAGLGDPAVDLAALSWYGEAFLEPVFAAYPELAAPALQERARFYRSTHALQQALWAIETGDEEAFADGIAHYV
jgi:aminoglycoside 2''-phosphotransferase